MKCQSDNLERPCAAMTACDKQRSVVNEKRRAVIDYIVACVNDFSDKHKIDCVTGFDFLHTHGGIGFLERNYDIEHAYSIETAVDDMTAVCRRNGGII